MINWTREDAIAFASGAVATAIDQVGDYESLAESLDSHLANALETINERGAGEFHDDAVKAFEAAAREVIA